MSVGNFMTYSIYLLLVYTSILIVLICRYAATGSCNIFVFIVTWVLLDTSEASTSSEKLGSSDASAFMVSGLCSLLYPCRHKMPWMDLVTWCFLFAVWADVDLQKKQPSKQNSLHCQACFVLKYNCFEHEYMSERWPCDLPSIMHGVCMGTTRNKAFSQARSLSKLPPKLPDTIMWQIQYTVVLSWKSGPVHIYPHILILNAQVFLSGYAFHRYASGKSRCLFKDPFPLTVMHRGRFVVSGTQSGK